MAQRVTPKKINLTNKLMIIIISILVLAVCSFIVFQLIEYFKLDKQKHEDACDGHSVPNQRNCFD